METNSILCIGELLIDFFCTDINNSLIEGHSFEKKAGGAPANVCATIAKFGGHAIFSGKVGADPFGMFLKSTLDNQGVDTTHLKLDKETPTTLAFVSLTDDGERDFLFNRGADQYMTNADLDQSVIEQSAILHFGSATALLNDPFQTMYLDSMKEASESNKFISYDPNYRHDLWNHRESEFIDLTHKCVALSDFVKVSDEELELITGTRLLDEGARSLHQIGAKIVAITLGSRGTYISNGRESGIIESIPIEAIDTTGAGDAFVGTMLYQFAQTENPHEIITDMQTLKKFTEKSNQVAAHVCTKYGAIDALPEKDVVFG
ncbi:carbohydrate kinase [Amphibacillus indicireducens]|uniref:Carbohydrate kinase n=1 Tax=Amphibacillus indicireducens TaxID=1076330 RepID=A0ABP7V3B2_9BACI